jgi:hypothetical protein
MNITQYFPAIAASVYLGLFLVAATSRPWSRQKKLFLVVLISAACWSLSDFLLRSPFFENNKLLLFRLVIITSTLLVVQLYYFCRSFLNLPGGKGVLYGYVMLAISVALCIAGIIPPGVSVTNGQAHSSMDCGQFCGWDLCLSCLSWGSRSARKLKMPSLLRTAIRWAILSWPSW